MRYLAAGHSTYHENLHQTEMFATVWPIGHAYPVRTVRKTRLSKTLSGVEIFENAVLYSCGWMKTELFLKSIPSWCWLPVNVHAPMKDGTVFIPAIQKRKKWSWILLWKRRKEMSVFKRKRIRVHGLMVVSKSDICLETLFEEYSFLKALKESHLLLQFLNCFSPLEPRSFLLPPSSPLS